MAYVSQSIANYNDDAPADDGSVVSTNQVKWSLVKDELADPIKALAEGINSAVITAFTQLFLGSVTDKAALFTVSATNDDGKLFNCTSPFTVTLPAAADAGNGFTVTILNNSGGDVVVDGNASETINGTTTVTLANDLTAFILICNGSLWHALKINGDVLGGSSTYAGDNTYTGDVRYPNAGELTISSGVITTTGSNHIVDTESDDATDDLDTITSGSDGELLQLRIADSARNVIIKDGTGNIETPDGNDVTLDTTVQKISLIYDGGLSKWLVLSGPEIFKRVLGQGYVSDSTADSTTTQIPLDTTIPQNTEGKEIMTLSYTPVSATSLLQIEVGVSISGNNNISYAVALFQDAIANALTATASSVRSSGIMNKTTLFWEMTSGTTSSISFDVRAGPTTAVTLYFNSINGSSDIFGGVSNSYIKITEIET